MLRTLCLAAIITLFLGCGSHVKTPQAKNNPAWYGNGQLLQLAPYEVVGFGEGKSLAEARANAKEMIAQMLHVRVDSRFEGRSNDTVSINNSKLSVSSKLDLYNLKTLKQEEKDSFYYVALSFKNLDFSQRVKEKLSPLVCKDEEQNRYLSNTPLFKKLNATLGCKKDFHLHRQNQAWYLKLQQNLFLLSDSDLEELFVSHKSKQFNFSTPKNNLYEGERFYFNVDTYTEGYITLLDVYENGIVTLLQASTKINKELRIPSEESEHDFEAGLLKEGEPTYELFVALFTKEPINMSRFTYASENFASDENSYKMDELIEVLQQNEYASILLRTQGNH